MLPGSICDRIVLMLIAEWRIAEWREGYFLDSRALVKRYVPETGTVWVRTITTPSAGFRR